MNNNNIINNNDDDDNNANRIRMTIRRTNGARRVKSRVI